MAAFFKYNSFVLELGSGGHNLTTATLKCALTNTAPAATDTVWAAGTQIPPTNTNGYTATGNTLTGVSYTQTSGVAKLIITDTVFTASGGTLGPFRYAILYNSTASSKLIGSYDYGSSITLNNTETFTVDFDGTNGVLTIT